VKTVPTITIRPHTRERPADAAVCRFSARMICR
jgi:hypothetical protein